MREKRSVEEVWEEGGVGEWGSDGGMGEEKEEDREEEDRGVLE